MPDRTNWHSKHPPACTCATCQERQFMLRDRGGKIGRNEKCPCDSGKKYKKCHGAQQEEKSISTFCGINQRRNSHASDVCERHISDYRDYACKYCNISYQLRFPLQNGLGKAPLLTCIGVGGYITKKQMTVDITINTAKIISANIRLPPLVTQHNITTITCYRMRYERNDVDRVSSRVGCWCNGRRFCCCHCDSLSGCKRALKDQRQHISRNNQESIRSKLARTRPHNIYQVQPTLLPSLMRQTHL